jgi:hypothetical protein
MAKTRIEYSDLREFEAEFPRYLKSRFGRGFYLAGRSTVDSKRAKYKIGNCYPDIVDDCRTWKRTIRFRRFDSVFIVDVKQGRGRTVVVEIPGRESVSMEMAKRLETITFRSETALLEAIHQKVVSIPSVQLAMTPIREIVVSLHREGELLLKEFCSGRDREKAMRYVKFLRDLGFLEQENGRIVRGGNLRRHEERVYEDERSLYGAVLSEILETGYGYIRDYLHLTQIIPYLRVSNSYFLPSRSSGELLFLTAEELRKHYRFYYRVTKPLLKIKGQIDDIVDADIFDRDDELIIGKERIFQDYIEAAPSL